MEQLPFSQACENNKGPILEALSRVFASRRQVLEIASGTGQHATWLAEHLPLLQWQPTEMPQNLPVLAPRCQHYTQDNLLPPQSLDVSVRPWPVDEIPHALFSANSLHIMPWSCVEALFAELGERAGDDTLLAIYGPFNYGGQYTSASNAQFDQWLAQQSSLSAIRDFEKVESLANVAGFKLQEDLEMPANNRLLVWHRA
ncbi:MAG: DUF938 domain-containing protein [Halioglobus sp.]